MSVGVLLREPLGGSPLNSRLAARVSVCDFKRLSLHAWRALDYVRRGKRSWYAVRTDGKTIVYRHREIIGLARGSVDEDRRSGDTLDNRRCNLRPATRSQILQNRFKSHAKSSRYKDVAFFRRTCRWESYIKVERQKRRIGFFDSELEAAHAYDVEARKLFGKSAKLNEGT